MDGELQDRHRRAGPHVAAAGQLDGATISQPNAANLIGNPKVTVLHNLTAAFRELQFTVSRREQALGRQACPLP
jgi:hypothetical protein